MYKYIEYSFVIMGATFSKGFGDSSASNILKLALIGVGLPVAAAVTIYKYATREID